MLSRCADVVDLGVLISGGDNGSLRFWDYESGHCFQQVHRQSYRYRNSLLTRDRT